MARISLINGGELSMAFSLVTILCGLFPCYSSHFANRELLLLLPLLDEYHPPHHHYCDGMILGNDSMT